MMSSLTPRKVIGLPPAVHYHQMPAVTERLEDVCTRLARELPRSLELNDVLALYADSVASLVEFDEFQFAITDDEPLYRTGITGRHQATYQLEVGQQRLGELRIGRNRPFGEGDLTVLESTMSLLGYPLRNALLYRDAIQAARQDALTGVGNRAALEQTLATELGLATRHGSRFSLLLLDLDHFKTINDSYGHAAGDETLRIVARRMQELTRTTDSVFRYGGEEFVILLRNTDVNSAAILAERLRAAVECAPVRCNDTDINVTISSGLTGYVQGANASQLLEQADRALYRAKQDGRNRVYVAA
ncbi:GGDEF domain-containing protein [Permianibacter sp. IMCC34836]|uniref:GGDEF domain-containing protein n=1 Tax=Permianibacter fluminis TaxID=2738515 RepID=UPI001553EA21|nr:GGDEF domain-containing protein [Permianibacter fluminis]NQD37380.1 GGDEF domain-containing protein [Permianibacter fluminis]